MKLNRLETHDRFEHFTSQSFDIGKNCQDIIDQRPFGNHPFYIFAHHRSLGVDERVSLFNMDIQESILNPLYLRKYLGMDNVPTGRLIWQPRLTKPKAQTNSMLFKVNPGYDSVRVIWIIPARELWEQYEKGKMIENKTISESIYNFQYQREKMEAREDDDLSDQAIDLIYKEIAKMKSPASSCVQNLKIST